MRLMATRSPRPLSTAQRRARHSLVGLVARELRLGSAWPKLSTTSQLSYETSLIALNVVSQSTCPSPGVERSFSEVWTCAISGAHTLMEAAVDQLACLSINPLYTW